MARLAQEIGRSEGHFELFFQFLGLLSLDLLRLQQGAPSKLAAGQDAQAYLAAASKKPASHWQGLWEACQQAQTDRRRYALDMGQTVLARLSAFA